MSSRLMRFWGEDRGTRWLDLLTLPSLGIRALDVLTSVPLGNRSFFQGIGRPGKEWKSSNDGDDDDEG
eukprot:9500573-Pyramimonas_sp.AAC.1